MICISIKETDFSRCKSIISNNIKTNQLIELRADLCKFTPTQVEEIVSTTPNLLITCRTERVGGSYSDKEALDIITGAIRHGAKYADIEIESSLDNIEYIKAYANANSCKLIISYHNFKETPDFQTLKQIYNLCIKKGADIVKIVTTANNTADALNLLSLYHSNIYRNSTVPLIAFAMGDAGKFTRLACLNLGSPFTYCCLNNACTAGGQYSIDAMSKLTNIENFPYSYKLQLPLQNRTEISIPCSKSMAQRAIIAAAMANGETVLHNFTPCNDSDAAINAICSLGCTIKRIDTDNNTQTLAIISKGIEHLNQKGNEIQLNSSESGLLTRLLLPLSSIINKFTNKKVTITGEGSLLNRNLYEAVMALKSCGITEQSLRQENNKLTLPITISGIINNENIIIDGSLSSQSVSGIFMALPLTDISHIITIENPTSIPYINLTLSVLKKFQINIEKEELSGNKNKSNNQIKFKICGKQKYIPCSIELESDWSSAAYFQALKLFGANIELKNMPQNSSQADEAIMTVSRQCGKELKPFIYDATNTPDLFPILSVIALFCNGTSYIKGVNRLIEKESNRAETICSELLKINADIHIEDDTLVIKGIKEKIQKLPQDTAILFNTHNDHRIAMSLIILSFMLPCPIRLDNIKCIDKSFPQFLQIINNLT